MEITKEDLRKIRLSIAHQMHEYLINAGDERAYEIWIEEGIPDCPCEDDFEWYANDRVEFEELCDLFGRIVRQFNLTE